MSDLANYAALGAGGSVVGTIGNYLTNSMLQDKQFKEQEKLQDRAARMNADAVRMQPYLQLTGMQQAGLNPATVNGSGAPSVQSGAAAGSGTQLGNIFSGVAEIVAAAKAPSEVEKNVTEAGKNTAETNSINTYVNEVVPHEIDKLIADYNNARNLDDAWKAENGFLESAAPAMFDNMRSRLQSDGTWDKMLPKTRDTINALADGSLPYGKGADSALKSIIDAEGNLSDTDKKMVQNGFDVTMIFRQMSDPEVMKALTKLPADQRSELYQRIKESNQRIQGIVQDIKTAKTQAQLNVAMKKLNDFKRESEELNDVKWLAKHGRNDDVDIRTTEQAFENVQKVLTGLARLGEAYLFGKAVNIGNASNTTSEGPTIHRPTPHELEKYNSPRSFGRYMDFR